MNKTEHIHKLFHKWSGNEIDRVVPMPANGSDRKYYRVFGGGTTAIAALNENRKENEAFLTFSRHFASLGLPVPEILSEDLENNAYLEEDLGDETLFSLLSKGRNDDGSFSDEVTSLYRKVVRRLPHFQVTGGKGLDYSKCYPRRSFDRRSMMWDLNYFKYYFLKLADVPFHEEYLEEDFQSFVDWLLEAPSEYFLYRDCQSRNVMINNGKPWFIDYQGGRKGALQYDIASLLFDGKADIPFDLRNELLGEYMDEVGRLVPDFDQKTFVQYYDGFALIRMMQAMGAYGFRGFFQQKQHFLKSVPFVIANLRQVFSANRDIPGRFPELYRSLIGITESQSLVSFGRASDSLTIRIQSFSYKNGIPKDSSGNGGGFVFDCRCLKNPKKISKEFEMLNGLDQKVVEYMEAQPDTQLFLDSVRDVVFQTIIHHQRRSFTDLHVSFGCTGGQHRSVYCAEALAKRIRELFPVNVIVAHRELV